VKPRSQPPLPLEVRQQLVEHLARLLIADIERRPAEPPASPEVATEVVEA
jgi:hypothetical protein